MCMRMLRSVGMFVLMLVRLRVLARAMRVKVFMFVGMRMLCAVRVCVLVNVRFACIGMLGVAAFKKFFTRSVLHATYDDIDFCGRDAVAVDAFRGDLGAHVQGV